MAGDRKQPLIRSLSRARFLGLLGFGAAGVLASRWVRDQLEGFRYNTVERPRPAFDPATYRLRVDGMVARPLDLTYDELLALPRVRQTSDFHCVEGWGVDDVRWEGVSLQSLMARAGPAEGARFITFHSMGGVYADSLTIEQASLADVLLGVSHGRAAADAGSRRAAAAGDAADVRLQGAEVGRASRVRWPSRRRLLGATRLGTRRVDRLERDRIERFSIESRLVHWLLAVPFVILLVTGLLLFQPEVKSLHAGGHRLVALAHVLAGVGFVAAIPIAVAVVAARRRARSDAGETARIGRADVAWARWAATGLGADGPCCRRNRSSTSGRSSMRSPRPCCRWRSRPQAWCWA